MHDDRYDLLHRLCPFGEHLSRINIPTRSRRIFVKYVGDGKGVPRRFTVNWTTLLKKA